MYRRRRARARRIQFSWPCSPSCMWTRGRSSEKFGERTLIILRRGATEPKASTVSDAGGWASNVMMAAFNDLRASRRFCRGGLVSIMQFEVLREERRGGRAVRKDPNPKTGGRSFCYDTSHTRASDGENTRPIDRSLCSPSSGLPTY